MNAGYKDSGFDSVMRLFCWDASAASLCGVSCGQLPGLGVTPFLFLRLIFPFVDFVAPYCGLAELSGPQRRRLPRENDPSSGWSTNDGI